MFLHIIDRQTAKQLGLKRFFTGRPCRQGHFSERFVSSPNCIACKPRFTSNPEYQKRWKEENRERLRQAAKSSVEKRKQDKYKHARVLASKKRSYQKHKEKRLAWQKEYLRERRRTNVEVRLKASIHSMVGRCLKGAGVKKNARCHEILGYGKEALMQRLEYQFRDGMSWDNYGQWEIDHRKPVSRFFSQNIHDPRLINMLCNLQPLWKVENRRKSSAFREAS